MNGKITHPKRDETRTKNLIRTLYGMDLEKKLQEAKKAKAPWSLESKSKNKKVKYV